MSRARAAQWWGLLAPVLLYQAAVWALRQALARLGAAGAESIALCAAALPACVWARRAVPGIAAHRPAAADVPLYALCAVCAALTGTLAAGLTGTAAQTPEATPLALLALALAAPAAEEALYRGALLERGRALLGARGALCLSSLLFAGAHATPAGALAALPVGLLLALLYLRRGGLGGCAAVHAAANLLAFVPAVQGAPVWAQALGAAGLAACILWLAHAPRGKA